MEIGDTYKKKLDFKLIFDKFTDKHIFIKDSELNRTAIFQFDVIEYKAKSNAIG